MCVQISRVFGPFTYTRSIVVWFRGVQMRKNLFAIKNTKRTNNDVDERCGARWTRVRMACSIRRVSCDVGSKRRQLLSLLPRNNEKSLRQEKSRKKKPHVHLSDGFFSIPSSPQCIRRAQSGHFVSDQDGHIAAGV